MALAPTMTAQKIVSTMDIADSFISPVLAWGTRPGVRAGSSMLLFFRAQLARLRKQDDALILVHS